MHIYDDKVISIYDITNIFLIKIFFQTRVEVKEYTLNCRLSPFMLIGIYAFIQSRKVISAYTPTSIQVNIQKSLKAINLNKMKSVDVI